MKIKQVLSVILSMIMAISMTACSGSTASSEASSKQSSQAAQSNTQSTEAPKEKIIFTWMLATQQGIPFTDTKAYEAIANAVNVDFELTELPPDQHMEQTKLKLASGNVPDLITFVDAPIANQYGPEGAFLEISKYLDNIPNLRQKLDENAAAKYNAYTLDNKLYMTPAIFSAPTPIYDYSFNRAAFEAAGVTDLSSWDKVYEGLKTMKQKDPQNYPLGFRNNGYWGVMDLMIMSFTECKANSNVVGYNVDTDSYAPSIAVDGYKEAVEFFAKLYTENLVDPEYTSMDEAMLKDKVRDGKIVMMADFIGGWSGIKSLNDYVNNVLEPLPTPQAAGKKQVIGYAPSKISSRGTCISAALEGDQKKLDRMLELINYLYSEEFFNVLWFNPDVAEQTADGYKYKDVVYDTASPDFARMKDTYFPWSMMNIQDKNDERPAVGSPYEKYLSEYLKKRTELYVNSPVVPFDVSQQERLNTLTSQVSDRFNATIFDFLEGKKGMDQWDAFVTEILSAGAEEIAQIYNDQYKKLKG